jgi:hypothetical protein
LSSFPMSHIVTTFYFVTCVNFENSNGNVFQISKNLHMDRPQNPAAETLQQGFARCFPVPVASKSSQSWCVCCEIHICYTRISFSFVFCFFFSPDTGVWMQGLTLARHVFYLLSHSISPRVSFKCWE